MHTMAFGQVDAADSGRKMIRHTQTHTHSFALAPACNAILSFSIVYSMFLPLILTSLHFTSLRHLFFSNCQIVSTNASIQQLIKSFFLLESVAQACIWSCDFAIARAYVCMRGFGCRSVGWQMTSIPMHADSYSFSLIMLCTLDFLILFVWQNIYIRLPYYVCSSRYFARSLERIPINGIKLRKPLIV